MSRMRLASALALGVAVATPLYGQGLMWGPTLGLQSTTVTGSDATGVSSRFGFAAGVFVQKNMASGMFLRTGAVYSQRGADVTGGGSVTGSYIEIPALLGYRFSMQGSKLTPYVLGGGHFGIRMSCKVDDGTTEVDCDDPAVGLDPSSTDLGLEFGGGVGMAMGRGTMNFDLRYLIGMTKLDPNADVKNAGFTLAASYMIPLGR